MTLLNDAKIDTGSLIRLPTVSIYQVDRVFVKMDEINDAISRHPYEVSFFGPLPAKPFEQLAPFPTGGYNRVPVTDEDVVGTAAIATTELTKPVNVGDLKLMTIVSAETQSYYGNLSKLVLEVETPKKDLLECQVVIFQRYWIKETKLLSFQCKPAAASLDNKNKKQ